MERETAGVKIVELDVGPELVGPDIFGAEAVRVEFEIVWGALGSEPFEYGAV